ncbi:MAG TPA: AN1-type zinc finger domain-containing protein [Candidatus Bathyarchaeia archaeon]
MRCQKCGEETFLPFQCIYCGGQFCAAHRLPENHDCQKLAVARAPKQEATMPKAPSSYGYTVTFGHPQRAKGRVYFSPKEIKHLAVAASLIVLLGVFSWLYATIFAETLFVPVVDLIVIFSLSFFIHEFAHKITAQREGLWAEFRLTLWGTVITLITAISPLFKIFAPGAVMISGPLAPKSVLKVSVAGPCTNIVLSAVFLGLAFVPPNPFAVSCLFGSFWNAFMAVFNLIPVGLFDGFKIFSVSKKVWALVFASSVLLLVTAYVLVGW